MRYGFLVALLALAACDSAPGPAGPAGATGPVGPTGPAGPAGSANVVSATVDFGPSSCTIVSGQLVCSYTWPALTQERIDGGIVLMYARDNATQPWLAVPFSRWLDTDANGTFDTNISYQMSYTVNTFALLATASRPITSSPSGQLRVAFVPTAGVPKDGPPPTYAELAARYGLPTD